METNYFTREYGVTRWEAWRPGEGLTPKFLATRCPISTYQTTFHGKALSMVDCRTWATLARPETGNWDPDGTSTNDPSIPSFSIDPLYTSKNLLTNTHVGGPYEPEGSFRCDERGWSAVNDPAPLVLGVVETPPWNGNGDCLRTITAALIPAGGYTQTIDAPPAGIYRFGASLSRRA